MELSSELKERILNSCINIEEIKENEDFIIDIKCKKCNGAGKIKGYDAKILRKIRAFADLVYYEAAALFNMINSIMILNDVEAGRIDCSKTIYERYKKILPLAKSNGKMYLNDMAVGDVWYSIIKNNNIIKENVYIIIAITKENIWIENIKTNIMKRIKIENFISRFKKRYETPLKIKGYNI